MKALGEVKIAVKYASSSAYALLRMHSAALKVTIDEL